MDSIWDRIRRLFSEPTKSEAGVSPDQNLNDKEAPLSIAIIGSGIGGLALAIGLLKQNVPFTLYESAAAFSAIGAGVGLGPNALRAMDMIEPRLRKLYDGISTGNSSPEKINDMFDGMMAEPGLGENSGWHGAPVTSPHFTRTSAHRMGLLDIMKSLIPAEMVKFSKRVVDVEQKGEKVFVTFADGEIIQVDTVIGCDGIKGRTRKAVLGSRYPDEVHAKYSGVYVYRCLLPMEEAQKLLGPLAGDAKMFMDNGRNLAMYPVEQLKTVNVVWFILDKGTWNSEENTEEVSREYMLSDVQGSDPRLIKFLGFAKPLKWALFHHKYTSTYYSSQICLLGDNAHATTPHQAAGAGQAIEDALVLSSILPLVKKVSQLPKAFKIYEDIRRPRAQKVVDTSEETGRIYMFQDPTIGSDMRKLMVTANERLPWIWLHDLDKDVRTAKERFLAEAN
ncbi:hypothetical protein BP5796_05873 [Coleophoma crateriformis]|uniref:FAD-binding domain-containing protein n=1 Tax=Coleophoma crateriformis TaxID=565419 RepID=A0A3D8RW37_9HELO|nr:hypothetical protein BP5796_05873 [Coleophoma crateriformis]